MRTVPIVLFFFMFKIISEWLLKVLKYFKGRKKIKDF